MGLLPFRGIELPGGVLQREMSIVPAGGSSMTPVMPSQARMPSGGPRVQTIDDDMLRGLGDEFEAGRGDIGRVKRFSADDYRLQKSHLIDGGLGKVGRIAGSMPAQMGLMMGLPLAMSAFNSGPSVAEQALQMKSVGADAAMSHYMQNRALQAMISEDYARQAYDYAPIPTR